MADVVLSLVRKNSLMIPVHYLQAYMYICTAHVCFFAVERKKYERKKRKKTENFAPIERIRDIAAGFGGDKGAKRK